jgi:4-amino-4-deoxy-L-arabinose transferase-like glycosyltransferase
MTKRSSIARKFGLQPNRLFILLLGLCITILASFISNQHSGGSYQVAIALWLTGVVFVLLALRKSEQPLRETRISPIEIFTLMLLIVLGWILRTVNLETMPYVLSGDEGSAGLVGWEFVDGSRDDILGLGWFSYPGLYFWLLSLCQSFFGRSVFAIRIVSSIAGTLSIAATYLAGKMIFNRKVGLIAAAWLTTFHYHVFFSRIAYNNIFDSLFLVLCAGFLYRGWKTNSRSDFLLLGFFLGFSQYFYTTSHAIPIILLLWLPWLHLRHAKFNTRHQHLLATILVAGSITLPLITTYFSHPETLTFTAGRVSLLDPTLIGPAAEALGTTPFGLVLEQTLVTGLGLTVSELQGIYLDSGQPMLFGLSAILFTLGFLITLMRWRRSRNAILLITLFISIIIGGVSIQAPSSQRLVLLPPIMALTIATLLDTCQGWVNKQWPRLRMLSGVFLLVSIGWLAFENIQHLFWEYYPNEHYGSLNGEVTQEMIEFLQEETPEADIYFIGGERMQFDSIPSITYLQPALHAESAARFEELDITASIHRRTIIIILPEQLPSLDVLASTFPESAIIARYNRHGRLLFYVRIIEPTQST